MSTTFISHILLEIYKEGTEEELITSIRLLNPKKISIEETKEWLAFPPRNHTRYIAPSVYFDAYKGLELWDE
jgi:hypothetical protein